MKSIIFNQIPLADTALIAEAAKYPIADLHEGLNLADGRLGLMNPSMRPLLPGTRICGPAVTSYNFPGDNLMIHKALQLAQAGQILVLTNGGNRDGALWGELASIYAQRKGIAGVIVDGPVRDVEAIRTMSFPVWAMAVSPTHPEKRGPGTVNAPMIAADALVQPGDIIVADDDGVLVIPRLQLKHAVEGARARTRAEELVEREIG